MSTSDLSKKLKVSNQKIIYKTSIGGDGHFYNGVANRIGKISFN